MKKSLDKLGKLKGRSLDELRVRGAQAVAAYAERRGWSVQSRLPTDEQFRRLLSNNVQDGARPLAESLFENFRRRTRRAFFASFADEDATRRVLAARFAAPERGALLEKASRIVEGRFDLLGLRDLHFGDPLDWQLDPVADKRSPLWHWSRLDGLDVSVTGDRKIVWELNRHQYFMTLGRAYWQTGNELYAQTFAAHLTSWMEQNPPKFGINWVSSLEIAFRVVSWLWAFHLFLDSKHFTPQLYLRALKFLYLCARHLETFLSTYYSPNTHLTGEALGLFYLGTLLPEFSSAARWRETGRRILLDALKRQVLPDGVYFEQTTYYQRYTADFYTHFLLLLRGNEKEDAAHALVAAKLQSLLDHLMYIERPDGTTPFIGDDDGGRLLMSDERAANDFRATLSTGAAIFQREDYKYVAGEAAEETLWLLGAKEFENFETLTSQPPADSSRAFPAGGYYVMRDGWTSEANYLLIDCGPLGTLNCGHAHADALSFELAAHGRTMLVDPGTYIYNGAEHLRDHFRSSAMHNTLTIDGESSSVPAGTFQWRHIAQATAREWQSHARFDYFAGAHDGYMRLASPAMHERSVLFLKGDYWIVRDAVETAGAHRSELNFHFAEGARPVIEEKGDSPVVRVCGANAPGLELHSFGDGGKWHTAEDWVSVRYGARTLAPVCTFTQERTGAQEFYSFLLPRGAQENAAEVIEVEAAAGRAFEILRAATRDVLIYNHGGMMESGRFASDFKWTWARFSRREEALEELVLIGGRRFAFDGQEIVDLIERAGCVVARRAGEELSIEVDGELLENDSTVRGLVAAPDQQAAI